MIFIDIGIVQESERFRGIQKARMTKVCARAKNLANDFGLPENFPFTPPSYFFNENPKIVMSLKTILERGGAD